MILGVADTRAEAVVVKFLEQRGQGRALHVLLVESLDRGEASGGAGLGAGHCRASSGLRQASEGATLREIRERANQLGLRVREIRKTHTEQAFFAIQDARAEYDLTNLKPGRTEDAMAWKPDPSFPDFRDPFRPQLIMVNFWSKSDPKDDSPRTLWLRKARETFDFAALAALLR